ncbi:PEGA domain protein [anaerobic digester metagenome]|nr:PEGA domain-containing protein [Methanoculleus sp.]
MVSTHGRGCISHLAILSICILLALAVPAGASATNELHIVRYAADGITVLEETTVDCHWLEQNLPVQGDGVTHYYHQGPVFELAWQGVHPDEPYDPWNPTEDINVQDKDMGAVKGTDLADLCDLVGGMAEEDTVRIKAVDGMSKTFPYRNVYEPEPRQGPMVITWYRAGEGYVPDYYTGMRLVFFADTSTNPNGTHAFGIWDMHECFDPEYWYFFQPDLPTTTGLSVQSVSEITIYSEEEPTGSIRVNSTPSGATVYIDDEETGSVTPCTLSGLETGSYAVRVKKEGFVQPDEKWVTVVANTVAEVDFNLTEETGRIAVSSVPTNARIFLDGNVTGLFTDAALEDVPVGEHTIELVLSGYRNATRTVVVEKDECSIVDVALSAASSDTGGPSSGDTGESSSGNGSIAITSVPMNASIFLDGNTTGFRTDATLEDVPVGEHTIELVMPGYRNVTRNITVEEDKCSILDVILVIENSTAGEITGGTGQITVSSVPANASIFLDGKDTGARTNATLEAVAAGEHTVELRIPGYVNATRTVIIEEGECIVVSQVLSPAGDETGANAAGHDGPGAGNPIEGLVVAVLGFINGILSFFGIGGDLPATPELESTPVPREDAVTPAPTSTPVITAPTPDGTPGTRSHSGGLYIQSYPPGMTIVIDNKKLVWKTPQAVYGLREGLHTIQVEKSAPDRNKEESGYRFETVQTWVYPDAISPVSLDGVTVTGRKTIRVESEAYQGERFTANGLYPAGTIPGDAVIEGAKPWITVFRNETFLSFAVPGGIGAGETYRIEPRSGDTVTISISSSPAGAQVCVDGFPTAKRTPCRVGGLSSGQHRILVSMPGYLPAEEVITIPEGSGTGGAITCALREYVSGDLLVESTVPDAKIYLYGRYTGEKTPHTFTGMSIGTYEVRAVSENDSRTIEDVLVAPGKTTRSVVNLKE